MKYDSIPLINKSTWQVRALRAGNSMEWYAGDCLLQLPFTPSGGEELGVLSCALCALHKFSSWYDPLSEALLQSGCLGMIFCGPFPCLYSWIVPRFSHFLFCRPVFLQLQPNPPGSFMVPCVALQLFRRAGCSSHRGTCFLLPKKGVKFKLCCYLFDFPLQISEPVST